MPNVTSGTVPLYPSGGTTAQTQIYISTAAAWVNASAVNGTADYLVQAGLCVSGTADALYVNSPQLFVPLQVTKGP